MLVQFWWIQRVVKVALWGLIHTHLPAASLFQVSVVSFEFLYSRSTLCGAGQSSLEKLDYTVSH